jgi:hypothetical protein
MVGKKKEPIEIPRENSSNLNENLRNNSCNIITNSTKQIKVPFQVNKNNSNIIPNQMIQIPRNNESKQAFFHTMKLIQNNQELNDFEMVEEYENSQFSNAKNQEHNYEDGEYSEYPEDNNEYQNEYNNYYYHKNNESELSNWDDDEEAEESNFNNPTTSKKVNKQN